ncbi:SDR family oxidoreductase [Pseudacidovorax sp. NFM-22]|uniref:SDR family oxidoreductase n=1 Tax=Pseudacidovorax sp. NFM-22 TaxID=2744469 RepID=UPI001F289028|nr:SDR family oxidoreductase [Pseudacidovorax sp. NFM-22]
MAADGIRVDAVCPGMIRTPLTEAVYRDDATHQARRALVPWAASAPPKMWAP